MAELNRQAWLQTTPQLVAMEAFAEKIPLPERSIDGVIWHTVVLMMADRQQALTESYRILCPGGRLVVVDWKRIPTPMARRSNVAWPRATLEEEASSQGFVLKERFEPGPVTWGLILMR